MRCRLAFLPFSSVLACGPALAGCDRPLGAFKLYRGALLPGERIHVATFDAAHGESYNHDNCLIARQLFERQPGVVVRYRLEPAHRAK